ncbi:MAG: type II secretion system protein [Pseudomonadota bacterium]
MSISRRRARGVTLIELILFIMIVGIALGAVVNVFNISIGHSADPLRRKQAIAIAESLLEEVEQARFTWCDPTDAAASTAANAAACAIPEAAGIEAGATRPYDNVNDYVTAFDSANSTVFLTGGVLSDAAGTPIVVGGGGYSASVTITQAGLGGIATDAALLISVRVNFDNDNVVLEGYRTRYAPNSTP